MRTIYSADWVVPVSAPPIETGAVVVDGAHIVAVGDKREMSATFPDAKVNHFKNAIITPGLINTHTHLELTAMRGYLENEERDFLSWLRKLTLARLELMTVDDIYDSALLGACEAVRAGITCVADASDSALLSMRALREIGLRGIVYQESFGPDSRLAKVNFEKLRTKVIELRELESTLLKVGVSPHAPYTVCGPQLKSIADFALSERLPLMTHAAESAAEEALLLKGVGLFADGFEKRGIEWEIAGCSTIQYLKQNGILDTRPLLAHCIRVDDADLDTIVATNSKVAHCPKSNAKLSHGHAPFAEFLAKNITVGLGTDSVASNNTCDLLEEARFALLLSRATVGDDNDRHRVSAHDVFMAATAEGARALELESVVGDLKEGMQADLIALSTQGAHQTPLYDPITSTIFASSGRDVILTVVGGEELYRDGKVTRIDEERLQARMREIATTLKAV